MNCSRVALGYHYLVGFVIAEAPAGQSPETLEPDKCVSWGWVPWDNDSPGQTTRPEWATAGLFYALADLREGGFSPFSPPASSASSSDGAGDAEGSGVPGDGKGQCVQLPAWFDPIANSPLSMHVLLREWYDLGWRAANGWKGTDLIRRSKIPLSNQESARGH